jgi:hypothetical protein
MLIDYIICGINIFCHVDNLKHQLQGQKYPPDVAQLCQYFEEQKTELPDYCKWENEVKPLKRRNEF